jgi:hypothetical protein
MPCFRRPIRGMTGNSLARLPGILPTQLPVFAAIITVAGHKLTLYTILELVARLDTKQDCRRLSDVKEPDY